MIKAVLGRRFGDTVVTQTMRMPAVTYPLLSSIAIADEGADVDRSTHRFGFVLFIFVNAVLFIRPADLLPALENWPIYELLMVGCLIASYPCIVEQLTSRSLAANPITLSVVGLLGAIFLSNFSHGNIYDARMGAFAFLKVLIYYLLLVGLINSQRRLKIFLFVVVCLITVTAVLALLQYHGVIDLEALAPVSQREGVDEETGEFLELIRLQGPGIFGDPNDFALVLVAGLVLGAHFLFVQKNWLWRIPWLAPLGAMGYALALTSSRGGFLSLVGGVMVLMVSRLGWRKSIPVAAIALPLLLMAFGGRQTNIDLDDTEDTFQGRVQLWRDGLVLFHGAPLFGIGYGMMADENGQVAHNSYVHSYAELGFLGGSLFVGLIYLTITAVYQLRSEKLQFRSDELRRWRPCIFAMIAAYALGIWSLSRPYAIPTYLILAVTGAYCRFAATTIPSVIQCMSQRLFFRLGCVSVVCVIFLHILVKVLAA